MELKTLIHQLKNHLIENEGELVYWGETLVVPSGSGVPRKKDALKKLRDETIGDCHRCPLGDTRLNLVFGVGNLESRVMFIGEGPGFDEDRKGEPFVGKAGQLLDKIIASIGLDRSSVYIANVVKCRPMIDPSRSDERGNDRPPSTEEMAECLPFLREQIRLLAPLVIVALGSTATKALLGRKEGIGALRGRFYDFFAGDGAPPIRLLPTFHPAALLRDESLKKPVWEDMKKLREALAVIARRV